MMTSRLYSTKVSNAMHMFILLSFHVSTCLSIYLSLYLYTYTYLYIYTHEVVSSPPTRQALLLQSWFMLAPHRYQLLYQKPSYPSWSSAPHQHPCQMWPISLVMLVCISVLKVIIVVALMRSIFTCSVVPLRTAFLVSRAASHPGFGVKNLVAFWWNLQCMVEYRM